MGIASCHGGSGGTSRAGAKNHGWLRTSSQWQLGPLDEGSSWATLIFGALLWKQRIAGFQRLFSEQLDRRMVKS